MPKLFKFRYVNEIVGLFVLLTGGLLVVAIILAGHAQEWFTPVRKINIDFPPEGSLGVQQGAEVQILGYKVGTVDRVTVDSDDGRIAGVISVNGDFVRFIRIDSIAVVKLKLGVTGDAFIEITEGKGDPLPEDCNLECIRDTQLIEQAQEILNQVKQTVVPALEQIEKAVAEYTQLAADLRSTNGPLVGLLVNLEQITRGLKDGKGTAGQILQDPAMATEIRQVVEKVNSALTDVKKILADIEHTTAELPPMAKALGNETKDLPGFVNQTQETIREAERLIEGIQRHWLLRGSMAPEPESKPIPPGEVMRP